MMHRRPLASVRARVSLRSISDWLCKSQPHYHHHHHHHHGPRLASQKLDSPRTLTTSNGHQVMWHGAESITRSVQMQIVDALRLGERGKASNMLLNLSHVNHSLGADDFLHILKYCARSPDPLFVMETWRVMDEKEITLNNLCSLLMMQALCKGGYLEEAFKLINFLGESQGIYPVLPIYNSFLRACAKMQSMINANQCLDLMEHQMAGKNEVTYSELLKFAVWQQNLPAAHEIWEDYIKHYSLSIIPLRKFIWSFTRLGDLKSAYVTLQRMVALITKGNTNVNRTSDGKLFSSRLDIPIPSNCELSLGKLDLEENELSVPSIYCKPLDDHAVSADQSTTFGLGVGELENNRLDMLDKHLSKPVKKILRWSFNDVIHACAQLRNDGLAEQLILQMQNFGLQPSSHTYDGFVRAVASQRGFSIGMEILQDMQQRNLKPYDSTLVTLSIGCSKVLELNLAEALLDQISECSYPHPFNAFFAACDTTDQPERAVQMLAVKPHAVCIPVPAQSHIKAMLKFAKLLHHRGFHITFVNSEFNHKRFLKSLGPNSLDGLPDFRFAAIPDGLPDSDEDTTQDGTFLVDAIRKQNFLAPFRDLLNKLNNDAITTSNNPPVTCIVSDGFMCTFTITAAEEIGTPIVLFYTIAACSFMGTIQFRALVEKGLAPLKDESYLTNGYLDKVIDWIPGMKNICLKDLPTFFRTTNSDDIIFNFMMESTDRSHEASAVVVHTFDALERDVLDALSSMLPLVYTIGPLQLHLNQIPEHPLNIGYSLWKEETECLEWLNTKAENSVVYVNFGSITVMTPAHLAEFGWGLANSKMPFFWVIRPDLVIGESAILPPEFVAETKERSLIASWCPQEQVLNHPSVGGFLTHSGWNSTVESLTSGVPMLCWPFFADQQMDCRYTCKEWGVGMEISNDVKRDEVEKLIRELMDGEKGKKMKNKAMEWKKLAEEATSPHGSSSKNLDNLVNQVLLRKS